MAKKKIYYINEHHAEALIKEQISDMELNDFTGGGATHRSAYPTPRSTGKFSEESQGGVGVSPNKEEKPEVDLKSLPKPAEIKQAWSLLRRASDLLVQGAPKLQDETMRKRIIKMAQEINNLVMTVNADINVNETDLSM